VTADAAPLPRPGWILQPGQLLVNNYRIVRMVGRVGGMSQVYAAEQVLTGIPVAIKVPSLTILRMPEGPERFLREARLAAQLSGHPNIVRIHACLSDPALRLAPEPGVAEVPIPFIVMEFLDAGDLGDRLVDGGLALTTVADLIDQITAAVHYAHTFGEGAGGAASGGIVHRDLKPENICFDRRGCPKVLDFGLARLLDGSATPSGVFGTPAYMAPEQWSGKDHIDYRTDIYQLGVLCYQMVTGRLPFLGTSPERIMFQHLSETPPDPRTLRRDLPPAAAAAILRALAKDRRARFDTAAGFGDAVRRSLVPEAERPGALDPTAVREVPGPDRHQAFTLVQAADHLARGGRFDEAIEAYNRALALNPREANGYINRGYCYYRKGELARAAAEYTMALEMDPRHAEAYNNRGMVWKEMGRIPEAIRDFTRALEFNPEHPLAGNNLRHAEELLRRGG
jgi:serine/threonine protein kinase